MGHLQPYPNVKFQQSNNELKISTPWLVMEVELDSEKVKSVTDALWNIENANYNRTTDDFLNFFENYPLLHWPPVNQPKLALHSNKNNISKDTSPFDICRSVLSLDICSLESWAWDLDCILNECRISGTTLYDPRSVYSYLRYLRLRHEFKDDEYFVESLSELILKNEATFFKLIIKAIHQTYFVTKNCIPSLSPAAVHNPQMADQIRAYIDSERGHHNLVYQSLNKLGVTSIDEDLFLPETKASMSLLQLTAENNFLAFCCLIEAFEGNSFRESDPIADLLRGSSKPEAAIGLERHHHINRTEKHSNIGFEFVKEIGAVEESEVITAARYTELLTILGGRLIGSVKNV